MPDTDEPLGPSQEPEPALGDVFMQEGQKAGWLYSWHTPDGIPWVMNVDEADERMREHNKRARAALGYDPWSDDH